ncbi:MAG: helix-turn-helix domain-containing protein [Candidatus Thermoplasmatota archaeon]|nr:helix-turn-helix domain-containing protein [Candidatus Thermoplasmatota archaeon]
MIEIKDLITEGESEKVEFKPSLSQTDKIMESISAFSNTKGGMIFIGVSDKGEVLGIDIGERTIETLANRIKQSTDPTIYPSISVEDIDGKNVIVVEVKESKSKSVFAFDRVYKRVGKSNHRVSSDEIRKIALEGRKVYWDEQICKGASTEDINEGKIKWFLKEARRERELNIPIDASVDKVLMRLNLLKDKALTNASILLFGKSPQKFFLQAEVRCIRFKGNKPVKPFIDMRVISGNIIDQVDKSLDFILEHIPKAVWLAGKPQREEKYQYPQDALREAIVNAICHRNYEERGNIQIRVFDDFLEVWSPGKLPEPLTPEDLKKTHKSIPRNPLIARQFFWIKFVEEVGTGTNDMIDYCREWGIPEPEFKHVTGDFVVTFFGKLTDRYYKDLGLNERQIKAVDYVRKNNSITNREFRKLFPDLTRETLRKDLNDLVNKRILVKKGDKRGSFYEFL